MRITIIQDDGIVGVNGVFRPVDLGDLDPQIKVIQFDTVRGSGHIEYDAGATVDIEVRDYVAEKKAELACGGDRDKLNALKQIMKRQPVQRGAEAIAEFKPYEVYLARWEAAAPPPPGPEDVQAALTFAVQRHLDSEAQRLGYDSIFTAASYAEEPAVPKFQAEGQAFRAWRSLVWARCYELLAEVQADARRVPTEEELIAELPTFMLV